VKKRLMSGGLVALLIVLSGAVHVMAQEDVCTQNGGNWDASAQQCILSAAIQIKIAYPLELAGYDLAAQTVDQFLATTRSAFLTPVAEGPFYSPPGPLDLQVDYELFDFSPTILSVKFTVYEYTGGAHGNTAFQTYTFDLAQQRILTLNDLFLPGSNPLQVIAPIVQQDLAATLGDMADATWIEQGTGTNPDNYQNFVLTPDALIFFFPPYQVAPYAAGPQTVSIPLAQLSAVLAPPFNGTP
jgi:hypothetical protein